MTTPACIDLKEYFGHRFRVSLDEAADSPTDPWYFQLRGERGVIYPHSSTLLAVECDYRPITAKRLAALGLPLHQDGDGEKTFLFGLDQFEAVAELIQLRKRRQVSPEERARLLEAGEPFWFQRASDAPDDSRTGPAA
jgi:hypothetical protein